MSEFASMFSLRPIDGINLLILLVLCWILLRIINDQGNVIEWADYIASRGPDGRQHGDLNKVGQAVGIGLACTSVLMYSDNQTVDPTGLAALLGVALAYLGGVGMYAANLRAKQGVVQAAPVTTMTETSTATSKTVTG